MEGGWSLVAGEVEGTMRNWEELEGLSGTEYD
jgi:hypothetical protein